MAEHPPVKRRVTGSNPVRGAAGQPVSVLGRSHKPEFGEGAVPSPATTSSILSGMAIEHDWSECHPAILSAKGSDPVAASLLQAVADQIWPEIPEDERRAFHRFCCQNSRSFADIAAIQRISARLRGEAGVG